MTIGPLEAKRVIGSLQEKAQSKGKSLGHSSLGRLEMEREFKPSSEIARTALEWPFSGQSEPPTGENRLTKDFS
jgi:hypothetical protein